MEIQFFGLRCKSEYSGEIRSRVFWIRV